MTHYLYISIEEHEAKVKELEELLRLGAIELRKLAAAYKTIEELTERLNDKRHENPSHGTK